MGALALLAGCPNDDPTATFVQCDLAVDEVRPDSAEVGASVTLLGGPFSEVGDTVVRVGGASAQVLSVDRDGCAECSLCRAQVECDPCETCAPCADACASCEQTVTFAVPDVAPGDTSLVVGNRFGTSPTAAFEVLPSDDGDTGDTGSGDTGDTGSGDTSDTGPAEDRSGAR